MVAAHRAMLGGREKVNSHRHRGHSSHTQILSKGRRAAWLWRLYACLEGVEVAERKQRLHEEKLWELLITWA